MTKLGIAHDSERSFVTLEEINKMLLPDILLGQLPGTALSQSRVVDAGRPPTKADATCV